MTSLLAGGGLAVLGFELTAIVLFLVPRTRLVGAVAGVAFHVSTQALFRIPFVSLWACYVVLLDVRAVAARLGIGVGGAVAREVRTGPALTIGALILVGAITQGVRGRTQSFPFACYPTFQHRPGTSMPDLRVIVRKDDGTTLDLVHARDANGRRSQRQWGTIWALAGVTAPVDEMRLRAYYKSLDGPPTATEVRFVRAFRSVIPEDHGAIVSEEEIVRVTLTR